MSFSWARLEKYQALVRSIPAFSVPQPLYLQSKIEDEDEDEFEDDNTKPRRLGPSRASRMA